jgi:signal transduction histidine kinase
MVTDNRSCRSGIGVVLIVLLLVATVVSGHSESAARDIQQSIIPFERSDTIVIASEPDYPPYCIIDAEGNPDGFSVELFREAAIAAGLNVTIRIGIWNQIREDLADGRIDALPFVGRTPEREALFDFTLPYLSLHGAIFVRKGTLGIKSVADLKHKRVGVMRGDNAEEYVLRDSVSGFVIATNTFEEAFRMLESGELDAVITQRVMGIELLKSMKVKSIVPLKIFLPNFRQDFCFAVRKGDAELLSRLNEGLSIVIANKKFDQLQLKWFGPSIDQRPSFMEIFRIAIYALIPLIALGGLVMNYFLRRLVRSRTALLRGEIEGHKQTAYELTTLKNDLEKRVAERTDELNEQIEKLNRSQKAMLYMVEDLNDMTDELKEERMKLQMINKELESFSYSVSHDLRAPLRAIDGYSTILVDEYAGTLDTEGRRLLSLLRENSQRMDRLITDLLALSRVTRSEMNFFRIDMKSMADSIFNELIGESERDTVSFIVDDLPVAYADPTLLRQVWLNLISNAIKYTKPREYREIVISGRTENGVNIYSVTDNGVGFNPAYTHKIFETFHRLHRSDEFEGTGVGLSIVQRIVLRHGGTVGAIGREGEGAKVWFSLPAQIEPDIKKFAE